MKGLNKVMLIGRLGRDPEIFSTQSGTKKASFSIATDYNYKNKQSGEWETKTEWHNIVAWERLADSAEKNFTKGKLVYIDGRLTTRSWEKDGVTKYITEVVANDFIMLDKRESDGSQTYSRQEQTEKFAVNDKPITREPAPGNLDDDEDVPF